MATCREIEKMVMPYINHQLDETQLEQFLKHVKNCPACREELEIYYTVSVGLWQLDGKTGFNRRAQYIKPRVLRGAGTDKL